jgi:prepilin-type N-terminal cleavage/methylation domain-containing protein
MNAPIACIRPRGFTLLEMAIVLVMVGLMTAMIGQTQRATQPDGCYASTKEQLATINEAIKAFELKNSRFPIPASRSFGVANVKFGQEAFTVYAAASIPEVASIDYTDDVYFGALPFAVLGLPSSYAGDCWGNKFSYVVTKDLTEIAPYAATPTGNMDMLDPAMAPTATNLAYVVISHGENGVKSGNGAVVLNYSDISDHRWCAETSVIETWNCDATNRKMRAAPFNNGKDAGDAYFDDLIVFGAKRISAVAAGGVSGDAHCWGNNASGQAPATDVPGPFTAIAVGESHTCAIKSDGDVQCWGSNSWGKAPALTAGPFIAIGAGAHHTCGLMVDGSVDCWGRNGDGQSNNHGGPDVALSANYYHNCAIDGSGDAQCWGNNAMLQAPSSVTGPFTAIAVNGLHSCAIKTGGDAQCWGWDAFNQAPAAGVTGPFAAITAGVYHTCAIKVGGDAQCWGSDTYGQAPPAGVTGPFTAITGGENYTCALKSNGDAQCWGNNGPDNEAPALVTGPFAAIDAGQIHTCAIWQ